MAPKHSRVVRTEFTRQAKSFAESWAHRTPEVTRRIAEALAETRPERVLDLACGPGVLTPTLAERAALVVGLDLTAATLREACARPGSIANAAFAQGDVERTPFPDACFDAAVLRFALHHCERPRAVLRETRRVLRPDARLVVLDVLTSPDVETAALHDAIERLRDPSHACLLSSQGMRDAIADAGLRLVSDEVWPSPREFPDWARVVNAPRRMAALERVLRQLARSGIDAGIDLREEGEALRFTYLFGLFVAKPA